MITQGATVPERRVSLVHGSPPRLRSPSPMTTRSGRSSSRLRTRSPIQTLSIGNHRARNNSSRRRIVAHLHRNSSPPHLHPCLLLIHRSAGARRPRLPPSRPLSPPVHPQSPRQVQPRPVAPCALRVPFLPLPQSCLLKKSPALRNHRKHLALL